MNPVVALASMAITESLVPAGIMLMLPRSTTNCEVGRTATSCTSEPEAPVAKESVDEVLLVMTSLAVPIGVEADSWT